MPYQITRPTGDQLRFESAKTGDHVLDTYLENAEKGNRTLGDMLDDLFDPVTGTLKDLATPSQLANAVVDAQIAAGQAANLLDQFDDRYLGPKSSDPTLDNDGNALLTGALYWNTAASQMRLYTGSAWVPVGVALPITVAEQSFDGTGSQTAFTLSSLPPSENSVEVFISGVRQRSGFNYTLSGTTLTFAVAPPSGTANVYVRWLTPVSVGTPADGTVTQLKIDAAFDATLVKTNAAQTITGPKRGAITVNANLTFDLNVANNFSRTTSGAGTLTFTNITAGQSGFILLTNASNHTISAAATTKINAADLATISTTGTYLLSYFADSTNVYVTASRNVA